VNDNDDQEMQISLSIASSFYISLFSCVPNVGLFPCLPS